MTGTAQQIDLEGYRLGVTGNLEHPLDLIHDDLRCMPEVEIKAELVCPGSFADEATWAGTPIPEVLALAGVWEGTSEFRLTGADGYFKRGTLSTELLDAGFQAYEWEGEPSPILRGFPVPVVLPEESGGSWIKWLVAIDVN